MYAYNPQDPHPVNRNNCTLPLRRTADDSVCGDLREVHTRTEAANVAAHGITPCNINCYPSFSESSISDVTEKGNGNNAPVIGTCTDKVTSASPAAGGASERCLCLLYIGDNGPCPVHGTRGGAK